MLMAMSNAENWLNHTKFEQFFKWSSRAVGISEQLLSRARTMDIFKKSQAFRLKHYGRSALVRRKVQDFPFLKLIKYS